MNLPRLVALNSSLSGSNTIQNRHLAWGWEASQLPDKDPRAEAVVNSLYSRAQLQPQEGSN